MNWIKRLFRKVTPIQRTFNNGDTLSSSEYEYVHIGRCPDCDNHPFLWDGPSGGCNVNKKCPNCGSEFNHMVGGYFGGIKATGTAGIYSGHADRISDSSRKEGVVLEIPQYMKDYIPERK